MPSPAVLLAILLAASLSGAVGAHAQETPEKIGVAIVDKLVAGSSPRSLPRLLRRWRWRCLPAG
jgi:hypothetical protein